MSTIDDEAIPARGVRTSLPPNHHGDTGPSGGIVGYLSGLTMVVGRGRDARLVARIADVDETDHVVDIGCGPGTAARLAARAGVRVTGVDPSPSMLGLARVLTRLRPGSHEVTWLRAGAEDLPLPDASSSVCWSLASVHHWRDLDAALAEVLRVLQNGGRFVAFERRVRIGASGPASHGWTSEQADRFAALLRDAGFLGVRVCDRDLGRRGVVAVTGTRPVRATTKTVRRFGDAIDGGIADPAPREHN